MTEMDSTALGALMNIAAPKSGNKQTPADGQPGPEFLQFLNDATPMVPPLQVEDVEGEEAFVEVAIVSAEEEGQANRVVDVEVGKFSDILPEAKDDHLDVRTDRVAPGILTSATEGQETLPPTVVATDRPMGPDPARPQLAKIPPLQADKPETQPPGILRAQTRTMPSAAVHPQGDPHQIHKDLPVRTGTARPIERFETARTSPPLRQPLALDAALPKDPMTTHSTLNDGKPAPKDDEIVFVPRERALPKPRSAEPLPQRNVVSEAGRLTTNPIHQMQLSKTVSIDTPNVPPPISEDLPMPLVSGTSLSDSGRSGAMTPVSTGSFVISQPAQIAGQVAAQMAVAVSQNRSGTTQITLSPEELGKVRMVMSVQDAAITMTVHAERIEVGDLLRRHIDTLADEFREMGFADVTFSFAEDGEPTSQEGEQDMMFRHVPADDIEVTEAPADGSMIAGVAGLDVRI